MTNSGDRRAAEVGSDAFPSDRPRHVWALLGTSVEPVAYGLVALNPDSVTFIATESSAKLAGEVLKQLNTSCPRKPSREMNVIRVFPDQPHEIRKTLEKRIEEKKLTRGDLLYGGGTTVMNVVTSQVWAAVHPEPSGDGRSYRQWYLPARGTKLLSSDGSEADLGGAFPDIGDLVEGAQPDRKTWRAESAVALSFPFPADPPGDQGAAGGWSSDARVEAVAALAMALLEKEENDFWSGDGLKCALGDAFDEEEWEPPENTRRRDTVAWRRGYALEVIVFAITARFVGARFQEESTPLPTEVTHSLVVKTHWNRRGVKGSRPVFELDVVVRSGPRFLVLSCGVEGGTGDATFTRKRFEADGRSKQLGGSEARSALVWWRSPAAQRAGRLAGWNLPGDFNQSVGKTTEMLQPRPGQAPGNSTMVALGEFFSDWSQQEVRAVIEDPMKNLPQGGAVRNLLEGSVFP